MEITLVTGMVSGPTFERLLGLSKTELGICLGAASMGLLFMAPIVGHFTHRVGTFPILLAGLGGVACGIGLTLLAGGFLTLAAALALMGIASAFVGNANSTFLADLFPDKLRRVMSLASALWFTSSAVSAPAIGGWLKLAEKRQWDAWSYRAPYIVDLVLIGTCAVLAWKVVRPAARSHPAGAEAASPASEKAASPQPASKQWLWIPVLGICHGMMIIVLMAWVNPMVRGKFGVDPLRGALVLGGLAFGLGMGRLLLAGIESSLEERTWLTLSGAAGAVVISLGLAAPTYWTTLVAMTLAGLVSCSTFPSILSLVGTKFKETKAKLYGYMEASVALAGFVGPAAVGVMADHGVPVWWALGLSPLAGLMLAVLSLIWRRTEHRSPGR